MVMSSEATVREILASKVHPAMFKIPDSVLQEGVEKQLGWLRDEYELGILSKVVVYDNRLEKNEVLATLRKRMDGAFKCVDFSYAEVEKELEFTDNDTHPNPLLNQTASDHYGENGLVKHFFESPNTDFDENTIIIYHEFTRIPHTVAQLISFEELSLDDKGLQEAKSLIHFLDKGPGRSWEMTNYKYATDKNMKSRYLKRTMEDAPIRSLVLMSIDEAVANDYYTITNAKMFRSQLSVLSPRYVF